MPNGCCGQPARQRPSPDIPALPKNPVVNSGVPLLYLGAGSIHLVGSSSGLIYHVSQYRRQFSVRREDAKTLLRRRDVILAPP